MKSVGRYDSALQMFVDEAHDPDPAHLAFLRWLGERNLLEHRIAGPSSGPLVTGRPDPEPQPRSMGNPFSWVSRAS